MKRKLAEQTPILNMGATELEQWCQDQNLPAYRARQIFSWIYSKSVHDFNDMTDLPAELRAELSGRFTILETAIADTRQSVDLTRKFILRLRDGLCIEAVLIKHEDYSTICISSQVGCALGCRFCATGNMGILRNLSESEIISEVLTVIPYASASERINIVFMGMGEPLLNALNVGRAIRAFTEDWGLGWSPRRITLSTAGIIPEIQRLIKSKTGVRLAISLNASDEKTRNRLMPINHKYPIKQLLSALKDLPLGPNLQTITFEYVMIKGINDSPEAAQKLTKILDRKRSKINLIPVNKSPFNKFSPPEESRVIEFQNLLAAAGFIVRIRKSHGADICGACGQLAGLHG